MRIKELAIVVASTIGSIGMMTPALATHTTTGNAAYVGDLHDGSVFDEVTLTGGVDWYTFNLIAGQEATITVTSGDIGNLLPNVSIFDGVAAAGETIGDAGLNEIFAGLLTASNDSSSSVTGTFTSATDVVFSLLVTTWFGQTGTYDISCVGCSTEDIGADPVPLPAALPLFLAGLAGFRFIGRKQRAAT